MFGLLRESWNELFYRPVALLKCFWFSAVFLSPVVVWFYLGMIDEYEAAVGFVVLIMLCIAPGAVAWHRHVIAGAPVSWMPRLPDRFSLEYGLKFVVLYALFFAVSILSYLFVVELLLPNLAKLSLPLNLIGMFFVAVILKELLGTLAFVFLFGSLMLHLPESALDTTAKGARKKWPLGGKPAFLMALTTIYLAPVLLVQIASILMFFLFSPVLFLLITFAAIVLGMLLGLSILTVAYRRNLDHSRQRP